MGLRTNMMREWLAICAVLFSMAGCGKDEVFIGLGHTYGQIEASSRGFIIDEKFPFRWRFDEALVHLVTFRPASLVRDTTRRASPSPERTESAFSVGSSPHSR